MLALSNPPVSFSIVLYTLGSCGSLQRQLTYLQYLLLLHLMFALGVLLAHTFPISSCS